ncbi:hypothetical protein VSH64_11440 [Amycolatopsis rhabdoformis]|uniref:DUF2919 domain-containing protein n=1 Tax=Amycolatopsis rhabdoformis TaxID=1448059 RepID=A0ABZ1IE23_9PSEU|nr:hypothetical protein [Amycolatopsis rhabdoformis]WSE32715.1 hypothetical protein VSH64_11440 [Amycolatopsis rhabdoformis]
MLNTDFIPETQRLPQGRITGLPAWYFVLVGLLAASGDLTAQFQDKYPWIAVLPLAIVGVHLLLWSTMLARRRQLLRAVWRRKRAVGLVVALFVARLLVQLGLTRLTDSVAPLHSYAHLVLALVMLTLTTIGAWFDQWLVLRVVNKDRA